MSASVLDRERDELMTDKILRAIRESVQQRGYPPSMREIGDALG